MARYFLHLAYDGTAFIGWQKQPKGRAVQTELEAALSILAGVPITTMGSGRTDLGVHAADQVAHFELPDDANAVKEDWVYRLNAILPDDIAVKSFYEVPSHFHARFSAQNRTYLYRLTSEKSPFTNTFSTYWPMKELDLAAMQEASASLISVHDFRTLSKAMPGEHYKCRVVEANWQQHGSPNDYPELGPEYHFKITANRFLRGQVRAIVGALLEVGRGKYPPSWIADCLVNKQTQVPTQLAPPQGLCLLHVQYPPLPA